VGPKGWPELATIIPPAKTIPHLQKPADRSNKHGLTVAEWDALSREVQEKLAAQGLERKAERRQWEVIYRDYLNRP
jgi:hypothetical protein